MHSWIFRHRAALARIYGGLAAEGRPAGGVRPEPRAEQEAPFARGRVERRGDHVVLRPAARVRR